MSPYIYEHVIAAAYGWTLEEIRQMDTKDFYVHLKICMIREGIDKEFQALLAGAKPGGEKKSAGADKSKFNVPNKREHRGATRQVKTEKAMSFQGRIKPVWVSKDKLNQKTRDS